MWYVNPPLCLRNFLRPIPSGCGYIEACPPPSFFTILWNFSFFVGGSFCLLRSFCHSATFFHAKYAGSASPLLCARGVGKGKRRSSRRIDSRASGAFCSMARKSASFGLGENFNLGWLAAVALAFATAIGRKIDIIVCSINWLSFFSFLLLSGSFFQPFLLRLTPLRRVLGHLLFADLFVCKVLLQINVGYGAPVGPKAWKTGYSLACLPFKTGAVPPPKKKVSSWECDGVLRHRRHLGGGAMKPGHGFWSFGAHYQGQANLLAIICPLFRRYALGISAMITIMVHAFSVLLCFGARLGTPRPPRRFFIFLRDGKPAWHGFFCVFCAFLDGAGGWKAAFRPSFLPEVQVWGWKECFRTFCVAGSNGFSLFLLAGYFTFCRFVSARFAGILWVWVSIFVLNTRCRHLAVGCGFAPLAWGRAYLLFIAIAVWYSFLRARGTFQVTELGGWICLFPLRR